MQRDTRYKRPFDLTVLLVAHVLLAWLFIPLWVLIPVAVWLQDRGPVFFRQERAGKDGRPFTMLKFRTMVPNAVLIGPAWTAQSDPRITPVGRFLRRTAMDELPGVLSIWKGDMSLVGPRALALAEQRKLEHEVPGFAERLRVRPGLTGLAQLYDRADDARTKLSYDRQYLQRMSLWLDVRLLMLSVWNTLAARWDTRQGKPPAAPEHLHRP